MTWEVESQLLEEIIRLVPDKSKSILELGSGAGSTPFLNSYYSSGHVYTIEEDLEYLNKYEANYHYVPLKEHKPISHFEENKPIWYDAELIKEALAVIDYDLILVDGPSSKGCRAGLFKYWDLFKNNVPVVFDDFQRGREQNLVYRLSNKTQRRYTVHPSLGGKPFAVLHP